MKTRRAALTPADPLTERLAAIAPDLPPDDARRELLSALKAALDEDRARARRRLEQGGSGLEAARALSAAADRVVTALWNWTTTCVAPRAGRGPERLALLAVGGYGRGVLAPFSDLDLLFLREPKEADRAEGAAQFMLYALWDLGLKVGWSARTVEECVTLARQDATIQTALLEMRPLAGDPKLAARLRERFTRAVLQKNTSPAFVAAKLQERDARHARTGASRYRVEPNVKDGKGGLRDLNTLFWIARRLDPSSPDGEKALAGLLTARERRGAEEAADFLWAVRHHLHFAAGRAEERLSFDFQPEIARRMGFASGPDDAAVKRFMRRYFLMAKDVGALTRAFCAKLEADQQKTAAGLSRFLPGRRARRRKLDVPGFVEESGRLALADAQAFDKDPVNLLRLFRTADRADLDLHPDAFTAVTRSLHLITPKVRRDPQATAAFLDVLARGNQPYRTLSLMNDAGLLGRFLPEFGRVVAQTQLNRHHAYTVDEHTLRAIGVINDVERGRFEQEHPLSTSIMARIADKEALYLAMLLHDTGKGGAGGQEVAGARAARQACERLGLERSKIELVAWLVEHHLVMSDYAQKRDVSDPRTVSDFARIVQTPERLRLLLVLTVADIRAVGPGV
ncbi:MAG TPA: [protein-PII] uridylyltransferase, partial [Caulobacteraceae bacterium]|nr:[protein-PII] uridylyltransferase [Caulobacteraceae bacterium]